MDIVLIVVPTWSGQMFDLGDPKPWKTRTYYICQEGGMQLWMGIQFALRMLNSKRPIEIFPYELTTNCKCSRCRYMRWRKKKAKELDAT